MKKNLPANACKPDYDSLKIEWLLPKLVISELSLPQGCTGGEAMRFKYVNVNFHFISFSPFGIPFKIDTEINDQPLTVYYVQGIGSRMIRLKDQTLSLPKLQGILGKTKMAGSMTVDLSALLTNNNSLTELTLKAQSKNLQIPTQTLTIQGLPLSIPNIRLNDFYLEANSDNSNRLIVEKFIMGDPESPMRANFKGRINLQKDKITMSPMELNGEIAFSESFKQKVSLDFIFGHFAQKDGFYQIRLGGTLGQPQMLNQ